MEIPPTCFNNKQTRENTDACSSRSAHLVLDLEATGSGLRWTQLLL